VITHTPVMDTAEERLSSALEVVVVGPRLNASPMEIFDYLSLHLQVTADFVQVKRYQTNMFMLEFKDHREADRVLHTPVSDGAELRLVFRRWRRQATTLFSPLRFKILISIMNLLAHIWSLQTAQEAMGSSCLIFDVTPHTNDASDMSQFLAST
jgi:hypothetical protein